MDDFLFPEAMAVLQEATTRHAGAMSFAVEAVDLAHLAYQRERDLSAVFVPGIPGTRRVRNDINDDAWRFLRQIGDPLITDGLIRAFSTIDGGDAMILPDGMYVRLKKGDANGNTSNYPTSKIRQMAAASNLALFSGATPLDVAIQEGVIFDVVFVAGDVLGEYAHVGLRFAVAEASPFLTLDPPSPQTLQRISPAGFELISDARIKLAS